MELVSLLGVLGITSIEDYRRKEVHSALLFIAAIVGMAFHLIFRRLTIYDIMGGFAIGLVILGISLLTHQKIGHGDGILLMVTGIFLGFQWNLVLFILATFLSGIYCTIGVGVRKLGRNDRIAFFPFVFFGLVIMLLATGGECIG